MSYKTQFKIKIDPNAVIDIKDAANWYEEQLKGLGERFKNVIKKSINSLKINPLRCSIKYSQIRCMKIKYFPYLIHYFVNLDRNEVIILGCLNTYRDPEIRTDILKRK
jgi:hypothetical protein